MKQQACRDQLSELMRTHIARIDKAYAYLAEIKQAIAENRIDALQQSLAEPNFSIDEIEGLERQRLAALTEFGFSQDYAGFEQCIEWCDDENASLQALYQALVESLVRLQHSIQVNSLLVDKGRERIRRSIGILTGVAGGSGCKTYNNSGRTQNDINRRDIAIA